MKFIQSTYKSLPYKKIGDGAELKGGTTKERPRGHGVCVGRKILVQLEVLSTGIEGSAKVNGVQCAE